MADKLRKLLLLMETAEKLLPLGRSFVESCIR